MIKRVLQLLVYIYSSYCFVFTGFDGVNIEISHAYFPENVFVNAKVACVISRVPSENDVRRIGHDLGETKLVDRVFSTH